MPKRFDYDEFVRVWNEAESAGKAAQTLGITRQAAHSRARYARARGYTLRTSAHDKVDYARFTEIYNSCGNDSEVAAALGISTVTVRQYAWLAREKGYSLNSRRETGYDYAYLAAMLDEKSSIDEHGSSGTRLRISVANRDVLDFILGMFPGGSVEEYRGKYRITYQKAEAVQRILAATAKYRKKKND